MPPANRSRATPRHRPQHRRARQRSRLARIGPVLGVAALVLAVVGVALAWGFGSHPAPRPTHTGSSVPAAIKPAATSSTTGAPSTTTRASTSTSVATTTTTTPATTVPVPSTVAPASVLVEVLNGMGQSGAAAAAASALHAQGFVINGTGDAASFSHVASIVAYPPGALAEANTVAAHIKGSVTLQLDSAIPSNEVDLVVGSSFTGVTS